MFDSVPLFPKMTPLDLAHKPLLDALFADLNPSISEFTFTNLYIWRHAYGTQLTRFASPATADVICILSWRSDPEDSFLLPPLGLSASVDHIHQCFDFMSTEGHDPKLCRIDRTTLQALGITDQDFVIEPDRDDWDYVYSIKDLIDLPEDRYSDKVQHIRQFSKRYKYEYHPLTPDLVPACQELQDLWCDGKHCDLYSSLRAEARAVKQTLARLEELKLTGGAILVNDRVQAFTLGEPLSTDTIVIHIEKASPDLHGAFQVINQEFLAHEWADWLYVNREQDMGDPGLRKAKQSYLPVRMVEKFTVRSK